MSFRALEDTDRRVLGAVRFLDATTQLKVSGGLVTQCDTATLRMNRSGLFVIWSAQGLEAHGDAFLAPPATPALQSISIGITVSDTSSRYLARRCVLLLPRDPLQANAALPASVFQTVDVPLYPSPAAPVQSGWALIRASVVKTGSTTTLAGALIRVIRTSDSKLLASGLSDSRGEALVAVPGIPVTTFGDSGAGAVIGTDVPVTIQTVFDPAATAVPFPDDLEKRKDVLPSSQVSRNLAAGRTEILNLTVNLP